MIRPFRLLRQNTRLSTALRSALALSFLFPLQPELLFAQSQGPKVGKKVKQNLDLETLNSADVDPESGALLLDSADLSLGRGLTQLVVTRSWRELDGVDSLFGAGWSSNLAARLEGLGEDQLCHVDDRGHRRWFLKTSPDRYEASRGMPARVTARQGGYRLTGLGDELIHDFDNAGLLVARSDRNGRGLRLERVDGLVTALASDAGRIEFDRSEAGRLINARASDGRRVNYVYSAAGRLDRVETPTHVAWRYQYDHDGRLTTVGDEALRIKYDGVGRVSALDGRNTRRRKLRYLTSADPLRSYMTLIDTGAEEPALVAYSADGRVIERISSDGERSVVEVDERDRPIRMEDASGQVWQYGYDELGRQKVIVRPNGLTTLLDYQGAQQRPKSIQVGSQTWSFDYDAKGNLTKLTNPGGSTEAYEYDARGRMVRGVDERGLERRTRYDDQARPTLITDSLGRSSSFRYNAKGEVSEFTRPDGRTAKLTYDQAGQVVRVEDGAGRVLRYEYNRFGRLKSETDEHGQRRDYRYNRFGDVETIRDGVSLIQRFAYDQAGRLSAVTDALGNRTTYTYKGRDYIVTDPTGAQRRYEFGEGQRVRRETLPNGRTVSYDYNQLGLLSKQQNPDGSVARFEYDAYGRPTRMENPDARYSMSYDQAGRVLELTEAKLGQTLSYEYNKFGDRTAMKTPSGTVRYERDVLGRVTALTDVDGGRIAFSYKPNGLRESILYPSGTKTRFGYDKADRLMSIETRDGAQKTLSSRSYGYDKRGRRTSMTDETGATESYGYDQRGRIVDISRGEERQSFEYDAGDNRRSVSSASGRVQYQVGEGNRLRRVGNEKLEYDAAGNMVRRISPKGVTRYRYNAQDKLVQVERASGTVVRYGYAPNGTRMWREKNGRRTFFLYDFADVIGEYDADGKLLRSYTHGDLEDDVLSSHAKGQTHYYHFDAVRSVVALSNKKGKVTGRYQYGTFGKLRGAKGDAVRWNPYGFTSRRRDPSAGLQFFRARFYAPELGRFTSQDPVGFLDGPNRYTYARNNPAVFNDPYGLWSVRGLWNSATSSVSSAWSATKRGASRAWQGTKKVAGRAWETTKSVAIYSGRMSYAFGKGFVKGVGNAVVGVYNMVRHPIKTVEGIIYAVDHWDETKEAIGQLWDSYVDAAYNDPEKFSEMTGMLTAEVLLAVVGTKGIDKIAKVSTLGKLGRAGAAASRASGLTRAAGSIGGRLATTGRAIAGTVASSGRSVANGAARLGSSVARRLPRTAAAVRLLSQNAAAIAKKVGEASANTVRRARAIDRARKMTAAREAARGGNIVTRTARRIRTAPARAAATVRLAATNPGAFVTYGAYAMSRGALNTVAAMARGTWTMGRRASIPLVLTFQDQITDAIEKYKAWEKATAELRGKLNDFSRNGSKLGAPELETKLTGIGDAYAEYRNALLAPIHADAESFNKEFEELNQQVLEADIDDDAVLSRMNSALDRFVTRQHNLVVDLYERGTDVEHGATTPSPNRLLSYDDEIALLNKVRGEVDDDERRAIIDARIAAVENDKLQETSLFRSGEFDALLVYVGGENNDTLSGAENIPGMAAEIDSSGLAGELEELFGE